MPRISQARREARRTQILDATRCCIQAKGLQTLTMEDVIRESGLSAGAVYTYFKSKEELLESAVTESLGEIRQLFDLFLEPEPVSPSAFVREGLKTIVKYSEHRQYDLSKICMACWNEAQNNPDLHRTLSRIYSGLREELVPVVEHWRTSGVVAKNTEPRDLAQMMMSVLFGFIVQSAIVGGIDPESHARAILALSEPELKA
jgi:AcrR family transcriptional regulator